MARCSRRRSNYFDKLNKSTRENKKRKAKEKLERQHQRVDRSRLQQQSESSRRPSEMAEDCRRCQQWCPYDPDGSGVVVIFINREDFSTGYSQSCSASAIFPYSQKVTFIADLRTNMRVCECVSVCILPICFTQ